jgi:hypothetical protein
MAQNRDEFASSPAPHMRAPDSASADDSAPANPRNETVARPPICACQKSSRARSSKGWRRVFVTRSVYSLRSSNTLRCVLNRRARGGLSARLLAFHLRFLRAAATGERLTRRGPNVPYLAHVRSRSPITDRDQTKHHFGIDPLRWRSARPFWLPRGASV